MVHLWRLDWQSPSTECEDTLSHPTPELTGNFYHGDDQYSTEKTYKRNFKDVKSWLMFPWRSQTQQVKLLLTCQKVGRQTVTNCAVIKGLECWNTVFKDRLQPSSMGKDPSFKLSFSFLFSRFTTYCWKNVFNVVTKGKQVANREGRLDFYMFSICSAY